MVRVSILLKVKKNRTIIRVFCVRFSYFYLRLSNCYFYGVDELRRRRPMSLRAKRSAVLDDSWNLFSKRLFCQQSCQFSKVQFRIWVLRRNCEGAGFSFPGPTSTGYLPDTLPGLADESAWLLTCLLACLRVYFLSCFCFCCTLAFFTLTCLRAYFLFCFCFLLASVLACLLACLLLRLLAYLLACVLLFLFASVFACFCSCLPTCFLACLLLRLLAYLLACFLSFLLLFLLAHLHAYFLVCIVLACSLAF